MMNRLDWTYRLILLGLVFINSSAVWAQPSNDDCLNAIPIACGSSTNGTTVAATTETVPAACYATNAAPSVWYTFVGDGSNITASICGSVSWDSQIAVFTGTCAALTCLGYNDDGCGTASTYSFQSVAGVTYYIRVFGFGGASGTFTLNLTCTPSSVSNDGCDTAIPVACGTSVTGTTAGAITDIIPGGCFVNNYSPGVWYSFTGSGGVTTVSLCGSVFDTQLAVLTGNCGSFTCQGYNDDSCGNQSQVTFASTAGTTYYVYVHGYGSNNGSFTLTLTCIDPPPPANCGDIEPNGCPDVELGADINLPSCTTPCAPITITAQYFETGNTNSYSVCPIPYSPYPYNTGTGFSIGVDDVWTSAINLPFNFCFFGVNYNQCLVGSNGVISFNTGNAGGFCPWAFTAPCPSPALPLNSIFGVYHDMDPDVLCGGVPCGDARYATFGTSPCRVFVVSFDNLPHFSSSCNSLRTSCEIVLYETTNVIEVFVENKPTCTSWNSGNALIGIQNASATLGYTPLTRNTGPWTAVNEGWRFIPSGGSNVTINWYDQNGLIGSGTSVNICPDQPTETFVATATYTQCNGTTVVVSDDVIVQCASFQLPVTWLSFEVNALENGNEHLCEWITATEENNDYFTIQRSSDLMNWIDIGEVDGHGNSQIQRYYAYYDRQPLLGQNYYRIAQTDFNGKMHFSDTKAIYRENDGNIIILPNPAKDHAFINPWYPENTLVISDHHGRKIPVKCSERGEIFLNGISPGSYLVDVFNPISGAVYHSRLIVIR